MKILFAILWTLLWMAIACIIPGILYLIYHGIAPTTELGQIILGIACIAFGGGISIFGIVFSCIMWFSGIASLVK